MMVRWLQETEEWLLCWKLLYRSFLPVTVRLPSDFAEF